MSILGDAKDRRAAQAPAPVAGPSSAGPEATASSAAATPASSATAPANSNAVAPASAPGPEREGASELRRKRDALAEEVTELHWDLGGLAYEMAVRDYFRLDVLVRRAALLQERDAELAELERLLRLEESASAGSCPHCSAPHSRGALFCWQCGATLMERSASVAVGEDGAVALSGDGSPTLAGDGSDGLRPGGDSTAIMDALLAPPSIPSTPDAPSRAAPAPAVAREGRTEAAGSQPGPSEGLASEGMDSSGE